MIWAFSLVDGFPGAETPRRITSSRASARLVAAGRGSSCPSGPFTGADSAATAASTIAAPSGSRINW